MTQAAGKQDADPAPQKAPETRLLDILVGWSAYLDEDEANGLCDTVTADEVAALYQEAGSFAFDDPTPEEVRAFFIERVLPLLMR